MSDLLLWEILVPTISPKGKPLKLRFHRVWDTKVQAIAGGLTILQPVKGKWTSPKGSTLAEKMIPVRIACTEDQIQRIADVTMDHYDQEAVMYYCVATRVALKERV